MTLTDRAVELCRSASWADLSPAVAKGIDGCSPEELNISLYCALTGNRSEKDRKYCSVDTRTPVAVPDISDSPLLTIYEAKQLAAVKFANAVYERSLSGSEISAETGIHVSSISRLLSNIAASPELAEKKLPEGKTRIVIPPELNPFPGLKLSMVPAIAAFVLGCSCNEMYFNAESEVTLPFSPYDEIVTALEHLIKKNEDLLPYIQYGRKLKDIATKRLKDREPDYNTPAESLWAYGQFRPAYEILRERFDILRSEVPSPEYGRGVFFPGTQCSTKVLIAIKATMSGICPGVSYSDLKEGLEYTPNIDTPMFWALSTWPSKMVGSKSLDFFLANDFIQIRGGASDKGTTKGRSKIYLPVERGSSDTRQVTDTAVLRALSFCFALPADLKADYISSILYDYC